MLIRLRDECIKELSKEIKDNNYTGTKHIIRQVIMKKFDEFTKYGGNNYDKRWCD